MIINNLVGNYFQLVIINILIFIAISIGLYLINFILVNNKYWEKSPKYVKYILIVIFAIGTGLFGFFYVLDETNYYFLYLIMVWILLFSYSFSKTFVISLILTFCLLIGISYKNWNNIVSLIINYCLLAICSGCFLVSKFWLTKYNFLFISIVGTYILMFILLIGIDISYSSSIELISNNSLGLKSYFYYAMLNLFSFLSSLITYIFLKLINKFLIKSTKILLKDQYTNKFNFISKISSLNEFIYKNQINVGYLYLIDFDQKNKEYIQTYHNLLVEELKNEIYYEFYYEGYYFIFIKINGLNQTEINQLLMNLITKLNQKMRYFYIKYGIDDTNLKNLILYLVNFKKIHNSSTELINEFDNKLLIDQYSLLNRKMNLIKLKFNEQNKLKYYPKLVYTKNNINYYSNQNLIYNQKLITINDFYNQYCLIDKLSIQSYLNALFINQFKVLNLNPLTNKLVINYPAELFKQLPSNFIYFINKFNDLNKDKNLILLVDCFDLNITNFSSLLNENIALLDNQSIDYYLINLDTHLYKYFPLKKRLKTKDVLGD